MSKPSDPNNQPKRKRATKAELQARVSKVLTCIQMSYEDDQIKKVLRDEDGLSPRTILRTFKKAKAVIGALGSQSTEQERGMLIAHLRLVLRQTLNGDTKNLDQSIRVLNIFASMLPKDRKGFSNGSGYSEVKAPASPSQLDNILAKLGSTGNATESKPG